MSADPTSFEISLPGPTLEAPLLFARHAERIEAWLRARYAPSNGYCVSSKKETGHKKLQWTLRVDSGWFSGVEVVLTPQKDTPHKGHLAVHGSSRLLRGLNLLGLCVSVPPSLVLLAVGVKSMGSLLLVGVLLVPLLFVWLLIVGALSALVASAATRVAGNHFDRERLTDLAQELKGLSLRTQL